MKIVDTPEDIAQAYHKILDGLEMPEDVRREGRQNCVREIEKTIANCVGANYEGTGMTDRVFWTETLEEFKGGLK